MSSHLKLVCLLVAWQMTAPLAGAIEPIHRWSFSDPGGAAPSGTTVADSIGGADGVIKGNGAVLSSTEVSLPGGFNSAYVDLPNRLISHLDNVTIEIWYTMTGSQNWSRLWDFGSTLGGEIFGPGGGGAAQDFWMYTPHRATNLHQQSTGARNLDAFAPGGGTGPVGGTIRSYDSNLVSAFGREYHVVGTWVTYGNTSGTITIYRDGVMQGSAFTAFGPRDINDVNNWLGRSNWSHDPMFQGLINEFRIYDVALTTQDVAASFAAGPDADLTPPVVAELGEAVDTTDLDWTTGGNVPWNSSGLVTHDGVDGAQSGTIGNSQESWLQTTVTGPGTLAFWWKVSSEMDWDELQFLRNGAVQSRISGEEDWQQKSFVIPAGTHTLRWRYYKDGSTAHGQDRGWLDEVVFHPDSGLPVILAQPVHTRTGLGDTVTLAAGVGGANPRSYQWFKNDVLIAGETDLSLTLSDVGPDDAATYHLVASNAAGSATSDDAELSVTVNGQVETVLLFADLGNSSPYRSALINLGRSYQLFTSQASFDTAMASADPANTLVVADVVNANMVLNSVGRFANEGGRVVLQYFQITTSGPLAADFNARVSTEYLTSPPTIYDWGGSPFFDGVASPVFRMRLYNYSGQRLQPLAGGQAVAGYTSARTANQAAIIIGHSGRTILNGFLMEEVSNASARVQLAQNEIESLFASVGDADGDGLPDEAETGTGIWVSPSDTGTDPNNPDTDGDGLGDGVENPDLAYVDVAQPGTNPNQSDTDGDGTDDLNEIIAGTNPTVPDFLVTEMWPARNTKRAAADSTIVVSFSKAISPASIDNDSFRVRGAHYGYYTPTPFQTGNTAGYVVDGNTISFDPVERFFPGERVFVDLSSGVEANGGEALANGFHDEFRAGVSRAGSGDFGDSGQSLGSSASYSAALGDLDGDGDLDAFTANWQEAPNRVWINDGAGSFTDSGQRLGSSSSLGAALGDLDGDGDLDAFTANWQGAPNRVWINNGSGIFADRGQLGNSYSDAVDLGDLDGDGDLDAVVSNYNSSLNRVWLNNGAGRFSQGQGIGGGSNSNFLALGDLDNDGDLDIFVAHWGTGSVGYPNRVWLNDGSGSFSDSGQALGSSHSTEVALGDVDGDGDLDAFVTNSNNNANSLWLNNGAGQFTRSSANFGIHAEAASFGDIDGDGDLDVFVGRFSGTNLCYFNDGSGNFTAGPNLGSWPILGSALGDLDGDGDLDAFLASNTANKVLLNGLGDSDGNGLPDRWEITHFAGIGVDPDDDPDGDGLSNLGDYDAVTDPKDPDTDGDTWNDGDEVAAGSDPLDPASVPDSEPPPIRVIAISHTPAGLALAWESREGANYTVQYKAGLADHTWSEITSVTAPAGTTTTFTDTELARIGLPGGYYRIVEP